MIEILEDAASYGWFMIISGIIMWYFDMPPITSSNLISSGVWSIIFVMIVTGIYYYVRRKVTYNE